MRCVSILNAGITFLDGSGVGTKYFCQPQERSDVVFGPSTFQDLEFLDFSYTHREDQGNLGAIEALGYMLITFSHEENVASDYGSSDSP